MVEVEGDVIKVSEASLLDVTDLAQFVGYVCVYKDASETHIGVLDHVDVIEEALWSEFPDRRFSDSSAFHLHFHGVDRAVPVMKEDYMSLTRVR